jgi:hypothetical protein
LFVSELKEGTENGLETLSLSMLGIEDSNGDVVPFTDTGEMIGDS